MGYNRLFGIMLFITILFGYLITASDTSRARYVVQNPSVNITVDSNSFAGFSNVETIDTRALATGLVTINLQASGLNGYNAASLRVYTENNSGNPDVIQHGLVGQTVSTQTIPFKVWTPNYGLGIDGNGDGVPDIENDINWKDNNLAVWGFVLDKNGPAQETQAPWNHPLFNYTDLFKWSNLHSDSNFHLPNTTLNLQQPIRFALVLAQKANPQVYRTQVKVEFALSNDFGETFTTYTDSMTLTVTLQDASPIVSLAVDTTEFNSFPDLGPWPQRVMAPQPLWVSVSADGLYPYDAATLRVYTKNQQDDPEQVRMGLIGHLDPSTTVPLKIWTANFGLGIDENTDGIADISDNTNWRDNEKAVWLFAFDWSQPITETWWADLPPTNPLSDPNCAWCQPLFNYTDLFKWSDYNDRLDSYEEFVYHLPNGLDLTDRRPLGGEDLRVPLHIGADFTDALPQTYSTAIYIEIAFSNDKGQTVTQNIVKSINLSATVPADGSPVNWMINRVNMRPDLDSTTQTIEKLADSNQEQLDWADSGWIYDQALLVMALTTVGHYDSARQILNGLQYLQNNDGSWFFSYMTSATEQMVQDWATTDKITLYQNDACLDAEIAGSNGYPDELEKRACWDVTGNLFRVDQIGPWILEDNTTTPSPQTQTLLPDKIKYRTTDFRKFMGANAWVIMAITFYELQTGDDTYRSMALKGLNWIESYRDSDPNSPSFGGVAMGRVWHWWRVEETINTTYGFTDWPIFVTEHNLDAYAAFRGIAHLTGDETYDETADQIKAFLLRELWAPHVDRSVHPEIEASDVDNVFFPGLNMDVDYLPHGKIDRCIFLDGQSWAVLALGPSIEVLDKDGNTTSLDITLDYLLQHMLVTDQTIFPDTGFMVTGIDGFKENDGNPHCESSEDHLVWSEGSEGVVGALYVTGQLDDVNSADYYHAETESYMMANGGVPYTNLPPNPSDLFWNWTNTNSIAGTTWFYFNEPAIRLNPFQYWTYPVPERIYLPIIAKSG